MSSPRSSAAPACNVAASSETSSSHGEKALQGVAEVAWPAAIFTGQGPQEPGVGMDLCSSSPAAHAAWEATCKYFSFDNMAVETMCSAS
jgi:hypothetical protein